MKNWYEDASTLVAAFGTIVLATVAAGILYAAFGWLGIALFGVVGLFVTLRVKLSGGHAVTGEIGHSSVEMIARQIAAESENVLAEQLRAAAERKIMRERILNMIALAFLALTVLGFIMLFVG